MCQSRKRRNAALIISREKSNKGNLKSTLMNHFTTKRVAFGNGKFFKVLLEQKKKKMKKMKKKDGEDGEGKEEEEREDERKKEKNEEKNDN